MFLSSQDINWPLYDPIFHYGDICKTILTFWLFLIFNAFSIVSPLTTSKAFTYGWFHLATAGIGENWNIAIPVCCLFLAWVISTNIILFIIEHPVAFSWSLWIIIILQTRQWVDGRYILGVKTIHIGMFLTPKAAKLWPTIVNQELHSHLTLSMYQWYI